MQPAANSNTPEQDLLTKLRNAPAGTDLKFVVFQDVLDNSSDSAEMRIIGFAAATLLPGILHDILKKTPKGVNVPINMTELVDTAARPWLEEVVPKNIVQWIEDSQPPQVIWMVVPLDDLIPAVITATLGYVLDMLCRALVNGSLPKDYIWNLIATLRPDAVKKGSAE